MSHHINTIAINGVYNINNVEVQVHLSKGIPVFNIVGLPDKTIIESRERIRAALNSLNIALPQKRIIINLAPANILKEGSHYDLPIAVGLLVALQIIPFEKVRNSIIIGELSLSGTITGVPGVLPAAIHAVEHKCDMICPAANALEAKLADKALPIIAPSNLLSLIDHLNEKNILQHPAGEIVVRSLSHADMADVKGQAVAKRAMEIAAAGRHNILLIGPAGVGKSMLAKRLAGLLPQLSKKELFEVNMIASITGNLRDTITLNRPFRDPHYSCSLAAMIGGGRYAKPGEITLAHQGILFLDELPEFSRGILSSLRQPLETREVTVSRAQAHITYPARFQLVGAMNPCKCGYLNDITRACKRVPMCGIEYLNKITAPLLDRIDMCIEVGEVDIMKIYEEKSVEENSRTIRKRVVAAYEIQCERYKNTSITSNAEVIGDFLDKAVILSADSKSFLSRAMSKMNISSMRSYHKILRVARTIADLEQSSTVDRMHLAEALSYRIH